MELTNVRDRFYANKCRSRSRANISCPREKNERNYIFCKYVMCVKRQKRDTHKTYINFLHASNYIQSLILGLTFLISAGTCFVLCV